MLLARCGLSLTKATNVKLKYNMPPNRIGTNLILSSFLAALSYLPFELIAKITLVICLLLFILDPYPASRIVSFCAVGGVLIINRVRQKFMVEEEDHHQEGEQDTRKDKSE